jgi:membrane protein implicated in regulation of membrane protease activity
MDYRREDLIATISMAVAPVLFIVLCFVMPQLSDEQLSWALIAWFSFGVVTAPYCWRSLQRYSEKQRQVRLSQRQKPSNESHKSDKKTK